MKRSNNLLWSHHYICRIQAVGSFFPRYGVAITRETYLNLKSNARKTEADIFFKSNSRVSSNFCFYEACDYLNYLLPFLSFYLHIIWLQSEYHHLVSEKIKKLQTDIVTKIAEAEKAAAKTSHQQAMQEQGAAGNNPVRR